MVKSPTSQRQLACLVRLDIAARYRRPSSLSQCLSIPAGGRLFLNPSPLLCLHFGICFFLQFIWQQYLSVSDRRHISLSVTLRLSFPLFLTQARGFMVKMQNSFVFTIRWAGCKGLLEWRFNTAWIIKPPGPVTGTIAHSKTHSWMACVPLCICHVNMFLCACVYEDLYLN